MTEYFSYRSPTGSPLIFAGTTLPFNCLPPPSSLLGLQRSNHVPPAPESAIQSQLPPQQQPGHWQSLYDWLSPTSGAGGGLSLSISSRPVPARLVQQIRGGRFIEMRDLLWDNVAVRRHYEDLASSPGSLFRQRAWSLISRECTQKSANINERGCNKPHAHDA